MKIFKLAGLASIFVGFPHAGSVFFFFFGIVKFNENRSAEKGNSSRDIPQDR